MSKRTYRFPISASAEITLGIRDTWLDITTRAWGTTPTGQRTPIDRFVILRLEQWSPEALEDLINAANTALDRRLVEIREAEESLF